MSKRDVFAQNIKALTRTRSFQRAIQGWELLQGISLSDVDSPQSCELCNTRFRKGAWVRHPATMGRKQHRIAVGGTCLEYILRGSFSDTRTVASRRQEVSIKLRGRYGSLIEHPGDWIKWIVDNAPRRLAPLAAQLNYLGMVPTDQDLNRLIAFHDRTRRYPSAAFLPHLSPNEFESLPDHLTIDEAAEILKGFRHFDWCDMITRRAEAFSEAKVHEFTSDDSDGREAIRHLDRSGRLAVASLAKLSDDMDDLTDMQAHAKRLLPLKHPIPVPSFAWHLDWGLAILLELSDEAESEATAWFWRDSEEATIELDQCASVIPKSEKCLLELEAAAFWCQPPWYKGPGPRFTANGAKRTQVSQKKLANQQTSHENSEHIALARISCVAELLAIARFRKPEATLAEQFSWLQRQVRRVGHDWEGFKWWAERYSTSVDCREHVDRLRNLLCRVRTVR